MVTHKYLTEPLQLIGKRNKNHMKNGIKSDLEKLSVLMFESSEQSCPLTEFICNALSIKTNAGREFVRYSLANALLMERKQTDYGPHNISKFGAYGCVLRMSDKLERLIHLFNNRKRKTANESISDSFRDLSNYAIIAMICDDKKWPNE